MLCGSTIGAVVAPSAASAETLAPPTGPSQAVIIEYGSNPAALLHMLQVDHPDLQGVRTEGLDGLPAVAANMSAHAIAELRSAGAVVTPDSTVGFNGAGPASSCPAASDPSTPTGAFRAATGADVLAAQGNNGRGTTVAVLDTGIDGALPDFAGRLIGGVDLSAPGAASPYTDEYGHGTFMAGLIAGDGSSSQGAYQGEAPGADLVSIKVAGASGQTSVSTVVRGIAWAIRNQERYGIKVLNLSLGAVPTGPTMVEPLDQAVEAAWRAGIVVVAAAGNSGPASGSIESPGDDPLAITVGAFADNGSAAPGNWYACPFSSVGPTSYDGWLKPDLVAPGRSVVSLMAPGSTIAQQNPGAAVGSANFVGSGTSMSTAITSGAAALVLAAHPDAGPDDVKAQLLGHALPSETLAPLIEGHGFLNAYYAATSPGAQLEQGGIPEVALADLLGHPSLARTWRVSSWNPANWSGSAWTGSAWTGSAWTGAAWNGSAWTGSAWTGSAWTGSAWTGSAWTGSAWTGSAWTGSAWTGAAWNGAAWNGAAWNGSAWTGSAWTSSAWS